MKHYICHERSGNLEAVDVRRVAEDFVWATNEEARRRALSLYMIRSIVEKYKGTAEIDTASDTININVPKEDQAACAHEIEGQLGVAWT